MGDLAWRFYRLAGKILVLVLNLLFPVLRRCDKKIEKRLGQFLGHVSRELMKSVAGRRPIWVHAVSTGEVVAATSIIKSLQELVDVPVILSTTCWEAETLARKKLGSRITDVVFHPIDVPRAVQRFFNRINPRLLVIVETDIWPVTVRTAARRGCPVALANGRISEKTERFYRTKPSLSSRVWSSFSVFMVQTGEEAERLHKAGAPRDKIRVMGNTKFDVALAAAVEDKSEHSLRLGLSPGTPTLVCGSTHEEDEVVIASAWARLPAGSLPSPRLIVAPRDPSRSSRVVELFADQNKRVLLRSSADDGMTHDQWDIMVVDTMGELADLYRYGTVAFVGGTFGKWGGHSLIEPLSAGRFTLHGPYVRNFRTVAREAAAAGAAREVGDADQLLAVLTELLEYEMMLREAGQKAAMYAATQAGSAERQSRVLMNLIT